MRIQGTDTTQTTALAESNKQQPGPDPDVQDFDATVGQLKTLVQEGRVKPADQIFVVVNWNQEKKADTKDRYPDSDTVDVPKNPIPDVIRENVFGMLRNGISLTITNRTAWFWSFKANARDVVEVLGNQQVQDDIEEIDSARIVAIKSKEPIPPPSDVPDANAGILSQPPALLAGGVAVAAAALLWYQNNMPEDAAK